LAGIYWTVWLAALAYGTIRLIRAVRRCRLPATFDRDQCAGCGYPKARGATNCPECAQSYAIRAVPKADRRAVLTGLLLVAWPIAFAGGLLLYVGSVTACLPNSALTLRAKYSSAPAPALQELDKRLTIGHARLPGWLAPPPGQRAYANLCVRVLGSPDVAQIAYRGLCTTITDDLAVANAYSRALNSRWTKSKPGLVETLEAMHQTAPERWAAVATPELQEQLLKDPSTAVRLSAARMLWAINQDPRATAEFMEALQTKESRVLVLFALNYPTNLRDLDGSLGPFIAKALPDAPSAKRGLYAIQNLDHISDETLQELVGMGGDDDGVIAAYHGVLAKIGPRAVFELDRLCERLDHSQPLISGTAASALGAIGPEASKAIPQLERMARDGDPYLGKPQALTALERIAGDAALPLALDALEDIANEQETTMALLWLQDAALDIVAKHAPPADDRACEALREVLSRAEAQSTRDQIQAVLDQLCQ
jgi:hypothetical protein